MEIEVRVKLLRDAVLPEYKTAGAAGVDIQACIPGHVTIEPGGWARIPTGLILEIPFGWEGQVRTRSGRAFQDGLVVMNAPGTIDSDYRGELEVLLENRGKRPVVILPETRIAQLVFSPVAWGDLRVGEPRPTERGAGGFGSTGL